MGLLGVWLVISSFNLTLSLMAFIAFIHKRN
jgi:energy-converting hydrogenase Eha subunit E